MKTGTIMAVVGFATFVICLLGGVLNFWVLFLSALLLIIGLSILFVVAKKPDNEGATTATPEKYVEHIETSTSKSEIPDGKRDFTLLKDVYEDYLLYSQSENNMYCPEGCFEKIVGLGGEFISFKQEPENEYDGNAVAIYLNDDKIGYIYRGAIQNICNSYIAKGYPVLGHINKYDTETKKATYKIGFYKPKSEAASKTFKLIKTKKKIDDFSSREDNLLLCSVGDVLTIEEDMYGDDGYIVYDGDEIGELPKAAEKFIEENGNGKIIGVLESIDPDVTVTVYLP